MDSTLVPSFSAIRTTVQPTTNFISSVHSKKTTVGLYTEQILF